MSTQQPTAPASRSWQLLWQAANACRECPVGAGATQAVLGLGLLPARLMLVGEQPCEVEDLLGRPFAGPGGRLLDEAFYELGWQRDQLYLSYALKHFKHESRNRRRLALAPNQRETEACLHWLEAEVALVQPAALVALGEVAARALLGRLVEMQFERGRWHQHRTDGRPVLLTLDPERLARMPPARRQLAWQSWIEDLRQAQPWLEEAAPP